MQEDRLCFCSLPHLADRSHQNFIIFSQQLIKWLLKKFVLPWKTPGSFCPFAYGIALTFTSAPKQNENAEVLLEMLCRSILSAVTERRHPIQKESWTSPQLMQFQADLQWSVGLIITRCTTSYFSDTFKLVCNPWSCSVSEIFHLWPPQSNFLEKDREQQ